MAIWSIVLFVAACEQAPSKLDNVPRSGPSPLPAEMGSAGMRTGSAARPHHQGSGSGMAKPAEPARDIDSKDILARTDVATEVTVKHVLIGWADLAPTYRGRMDPRAGKRNNAEAVKLAQEVLAKLVTNPADLDAIVKEHSEDPGSKTGAPYTIGADTQFVPEFKNLALRLKEKESGIVKTMYGYHVISRIPPPPPDPLESADIMKREMKTGDIEVQHILIGWKDSPAARDPRAKARSKEDADKLAKEVLAKVKAGGDMGKLMKEFSEDPGSKDTGRAYEVAKDSPLVEQFKKLALRLEVGEAGLAKTEFGWHVIKRIKPDALNSSDILARKPATEKAKVKHILLGWTDAHTEDERGKKRTRAELEKLVAETVAKLKKGDAIEPLMKQLSEDPGSKETGESYEATPTAGLVPPFKNLALRLEKNEVGTVKTQFGIHIIKRVE